VRAFGLPPALEVDLIRLTTPAVTNEWSVANVDAILDQLYAVTARDHPGAGESLISLAGLPPLLADLERPRLDRPPPPGLRRLAGSALRRIGGTPRRRLPTSRRLTLVVAMHLH
jgi:hypothetical protein